MSTRLLSVQGKVHELSDDLESHFFVLLFEGLHFVKHNKPDDILPRGIFDQSDVNPETGSHKGGQGKAFLYSGVIPTMSKKLAFTSKPFTTLVRELYRVFMSLHQYHAAKDMEIDPHESLVTSIGALEGCVGVEALFDEALKSEEWPTECDKVQDQYPPTKRLKPEQKDTVALSYINRSVVQEPSSGKRKRETGGENRRSLRKKRSKAGSQRLSAPPLADDASYLPNMYLCVYLTLRKIRALALL